MVKVRKSLIGNQFGELTVIEQVDDYIDPSGAHRAKWKCLCSCGNECSVVGNHLKNEHTTSCGCKSIQMLVERSKKYNEYDLSGEYGIGYTSNTHQPFYFDLSDYDKIKDICWIESHLDKATHELIGHMPGTKGKIINMHILLGYKGYDHIDRNELNNRSNNLRKCTHQENDCNKSKLNTNTSGITGVSLKKSTQKWVAYIMYMGTQYHLGYFISKDDAIRARLKAEQRYFGEFAPQRHLFEQYCITQQND